MVTIKDIAREAGVSYSTVSVALGNRKTKLPLSEKTREKVFAAVQKLGYRRNALAGQIRTGKTWSLSFASAMLEQEYVTGILLGVMEKADELGYSVRICRVTPENPAAVYDRMLENRQDAVIAVNELPDVDCLLRGARQLGIPVGCADCKADAGYDVCVSSDDSCAVEESVRQLYELGWRRFTFLAERQVERLYVIPRREGFLRAMDRLGLPVEREFSRWAIDEMLKEAPPPRAVVCSSDGVALQFLLEAQRRGFRIPEEYAVIGFGNLNFGQEFCRPSLSTVSQNYREIGRCVTEKLIARLGSPALPEHCVVPTRVILRESTGPAPGFNQKIYSEEEA